MNDVPISSLPDGLSVRPARPSDLSAIYDLLAEYETSIEGWVESSFEDVRSLTRVGHFNFATDLVTAWEGDELVGWALVWNGDPDQAPSDSMAVTRPSHKGRGIGSYLLDRLEARHREIHSEGPGRSPLLWVHTESGDGAARELLASRGYEEIRRHYTMAIDLGEIDPVSEPPGFTFRACTEDDLPVFHRLVEETFSEHWGFTSETYEDFYSSTVDRPDTRFDLWLLAWHEEEPVAVMLGRVKDDVGWVDILGVQKGFRKRGLGEALLNRAFMIFQSEGLATAYLGVDATNATGAVALYERAGMRSVRVFVSYEKNVV